MKVTPELITSLKPGEVFVFGSNLSGIHGKGAAKQAEEHFGAKRGVAFGPTGQCYAIPTRGIWMRHTRAFEPMSIDQIGERIWDFLSFAESHPELEFLVTAIGCGYAGFDLQTVAPLFFRRSIPDNVHLPRTFWLYGPA